MKYLLTGVLAIFTLISHAQKTKTMNEVKCVEMVLFRPKENVTQEQLKKAMMATNEVVKTFEGFISRTTSIQENGEFLDIVYWTSKAAALDAAQKAQTHPEIMKNFAFIEPKSIKMQHSEVFAIEE